MWSGRFCIATLLVCLTLAASAGHATSETFKGRKLTITDGRTDPQFAAPLVVAMHGFLGTPRSMQQKTSFDALARTHGFTVLYPKGLGRRWNDGRSPSSKTDDVAYLAALISTFVANGVADPKRVYLAGHSNGGGMAMRMACDRPNLVAGISVVATKSALNYRCQSGAASPAIFMHGTLDPVSPHGGRNADSRLGGALSAKSTLAIWAARNACGRPVQAQTIDRLSDGTAAKIFRYTNCRKAPLAYVLIEGHGHGWPGAGPRLRRVQGPATQEVNAAALSWAFFSKL